VRANNTRNFFRSNASPLGVVPHVVGNRKLDDAKESFFTKHACFPSCSARRHTSINGLRELAVKIARLLTRGTSRESESDERKRDGRLGST